MKQTCINILLLLFVGIAPLAADDSIAVALPENNTFPQPELFQKMADNVVVIQDSAITRLLNDKIEGIERETVQLQGYRVQVYSGNRQQTAKAEAFRIEKLIQESGLGVETYVLYNPPFWKVRLGNFRTQAEAQQLRDEVVRLLPSLQGDTYVVRDQVQIIQ